MGGDTVIRRSIPGVGGVLGELLSDRPLEPTVRHVETVSTSDTPGPPTHARSGRPPGVRSVTPAGKSKLTVRIDAALIEQYRDWSWDARCNLGELVERAMRTHVRTRTQGE